MTKSKSKGRRVTADEREWETCVEIDCDNLVARFVRGDFYCRKHVPADGHVKDYPRNDKQTNTEYAVYLEMVGRDYRESGADATADDYAEAARRLRLADKEVKS